MTDFRRVLLTDKNAWELFGLANKERILRITDGESESPRPARGAVSQRALSFLVLFESVIVHDFGQGAFHIPSLEGEGILEVVSHGDPAHLVEPLRTQWKRGPLRDRLNPPPDSLLRSLRLFKEERALVIDRLLSVRSDWERSHAKALGITRRGFLDAFFDYALACVEGDELILNGSVLNRLPDDMLSHWHQRLFDFSLDGDLMDEFSAKAVFAIAFADEIRIIQELSEELGVGVATEHYRSKPPFRPMAPDANSAADHFAVVRAAIAEEAGGLPRIRDIRHALALRRDPNLRSLRRLLREFHTALKVGDVDAVVQRASRGGAGETGHRATFQLATEPGLGRLPRPSGRDR